MPPLYSESSKLSAQLKRVWGVMFSVGIPMPIGMWSWPARVSSFAVTFARAVVSSDAVTISFTSIHGCWIASKIAAVSSMNDPMSVSMIAGCLTPFGQTGVSLC